MSSRVKKSLEFIGLLTSTAEVSSSLTKSLLSKASDGNVMAVIELVVNALAGNIELDEERRRSLLKSRVILKRLALQTIPSKARENLVKHYKTVFLISLYL